MEPRYLHLRPENLPPAMATNPYLAVIIADVSVSDDWLHQIAKWIVEIGTLYVVVWGVDCEKWHDRVDWAVLELFDFNDIPDERFVMTTWHSNEPMSEAFWFAGNCATHPDVELSETIILHIAVETQCAALVQSYRDSQGAADNA